MAVQTIPQEKKKLVLLEPLYFRASLLQQPGLYRHTHTHTIYTYIFNTFIQQQEEFQKHDAE